MSAMVLATALALGLGGCGTGPAVETTAPAAPTANPAPDAARSRNDPLAIERQWLLSFFSGTPVAIERSDDATLTVAVPSEFCFDSGSANIKPPLAKVLQKLAQSLRRRPQFTVASVEAPADAATDSALAVKRARAIQQRLRTLGVDQRRFTGIGTSASSTVRLRLQAGASPA